MVPSGYMLIDFMSLTDRVFDPYMWVVLLGPERLVGIWLGQPSNDDAYPYGTEECVSFSRLFKDIHTDSIGWAVESLFGSSMENDLMRNQWVDKASSMLCGVSLCIMDLIKFGHVECARVVIPYPFFMDDHQTYLQEQVREVARMIAGSVVKHHCGSEDGIRWLGREEFRFSHETSMFISFFSFTVDMRDYDHDNEEEEDDDNVDEPDNGSNFECNLDISVDFSSISRGQEISRYNDRFLIADIVGILKY